MSEYRSVKNRPTKIEDTILKLTSVVSNNGLLIDLDSSGLASENTLAIILNELSLLSPTADGNYLRNKLYFMLDGAEQVVNEDTLVPANNAPLPVKLTSATGPINITAGDLNVHLSHVGVNYDSTRIGDGTNLMAVNASNEALVSDAAVLEKLTETNALVISIEDVIDNMTFTGSNELSVNDADANGFLDRITASTSIPSTIGTVINADIDVAAEQITASDLPCKYCIVQANSTNTDQIWLGDSNVAPQRGILLFPTDSYRIEINNVNKLYVYATAVDQGVSVTYFN